MKVPGTAGEGRAGAHQRLRQVGRGRVLRARSPRSACRSFPPAARPSSWRRKACASPRCRRTPAFRKCSTAASRRCTRRSTAASSRGATSREHMAAIEKAGIAPIDLIVVNLYPFEATVADPDCTLENAIENIDIGGPTMLRAAAKNHAGVAVVVDPADYARVLEEIRATGGVARGDALRAGEEGVRAHRRLRWRDRELPVLAGRRTETRSAYPERPQPAIPQAAGHALRRESAPVGGVLPRPAAGGGRHRRLSAAAGQGTLLQQRRRFRRRLGMREELRRTGLRHRQARQSLRRGDRRTPLGGLPQGVQDRPDLRLRRHPRLQPRARPRRRGGNRQAVRRSDHRAAHRARGARVPRREAEPARARGADVARSAGARLQARRRRPAGAEQ